MGREGGGGGGRTEEGGGGRAISLLLNIMSVHAASLTQYISQQKCSLISGKQPIIQKGKIKVRDRDLETDASGEESLSKCVILLLNLAEVMSGKTERGDTSQQMVQRKCYSCQQ